MEAHNARASNIRQLLAVHIPPRHAIEVGEHTGTAGNTKWIGPARDLLPPASSIFNSHISPKNHHLAPIATTLYFNVHHSESKQPHNRLMQRRNAIFIHLRHLLTVHRPADGVFRRYQCLQMCNRGPAWNRAPWNRISLIFSKAQKTLDLQDRGAHSRE